jgi:hypothetical protein
MKPQAKAMIDHDTENCEGDPAPTFHRQRANVSDALLLSKHSTPDRLRFINHLRKSAYGRSETAAQGRQQAVEGKPEEGAVDLISGS